MLRYSLAALALKTFSLNSATKSLYRSLGNKIGGKRRQQGQVDFDAYVKRGNLLVDLYRKFEDLKPTDRLLELGTGWMHWYAVYLRLAIACRITTLDVWDNRQFDGMKANLTRLPTGNPLLSKLLETESFQEFYKQLDFNHVIVPNGLLDSFANDSLTSVFSMHVLEHVPRTSIEAVIGGMHRAMKAGHHTIHQIGIDDHLAHYDRSVSHKKYITFSNRTWKTFFENEVQYQNRLQPVDWHRLFEQAGFELVHEERELTSIDDLSVSEDFKHYSEKDLGCTILTLVLRRK